MKNVGLLSVLITLSMQCYGQLNDIRIYDAPEVKVDLRLIDEGTASLLINNFDGVECVLLSYVFRPDTLVFIESNECLKVKSDIYYTKHDGIEKDSIILESLFGHVYMSGNSSFHDFQYKINGNYYRASEDDIYHEAKIARPKNDKFELEMYNGEKFLSSVTVNISEGMNLIRIQTIELFSNYYSNIDFGKIFPTIINIQGEDIVVTFLRE